MTTEDRPYPASEYKLSQLRKQGVLPLSKNLLSGAKIAALLSVSAYIWNSAAVAFSRYRHISLDHLGLLGSKEDTTTVGLLLPAIFVVFQKVLLPIALVMLVFIAFFGLLQSKFYFSPVRALPQIGRLFRRKGLSILGRVEDALVELIIAGIWIFLVLLFLQILVSRGDPVLFPQAATQPGGQLMVAHLSPLDGAAAKQQSTDDQIQPTVLNGSRASNEVLHALSGRIQLWGYFAFGFAVPLALLSWIARFLAFRRAQMMSRSEMEAELRELEMRPEVRQAVRDSSVE